MSKNIIVQEGGNSYQFTAKKLKTDKVGGGYVLWIPEDEVPLGTKRVTENGTYKAEDDSLAGYLKVRVNVRGANGSADSLGKPRTVFDSDGNIEYAPGGIGSAVFGTDPNTGEWVTVGVDSEGNLVTTSIPAAIEIVTNPTKTSYSKGETINYSGIDVILKTRSGNTFTNATYANGHIPMQELIFTVNTASGAVNPSGGGEVHNGAYYISSGNKLSVCTQEDGTGGDMLTPAGTRLCGIRRINETDFYVVAMNDSPFTMQCYMQDTGELENDWPASLMHFDGVSKYVSTIRFYNPVATPIIDFNQPSPTDTRSIQQIAYDIMYGSDSSTQVIPVMWKSPYTGDTFTDTFDIAVSGSSSSSSGSDSGSTDGGGYSDDSGGSSSGGGGGF